ncbi:hypothetical protein ABQW55_005485 [Xanthomonas citri pv. malvacearum]|nr:hypothetical protein [Xanthomonas citri]MCC4631512.1 hypothetical protein [Xanthomonas citri]WAW88063.1 hypothetical protein LPY96_06185 [Xanthomonas citri pv. malvacearum]WAW92194.1 hypothetical protein LPY95_05455 [Xanthomonas citri pv. malvacearum]WAW96363.1 hypothetical protein LGM68_05485 [Xanthomonas citri pv. malvacearum]
MSYQPVPTVSVMTPQARFTLCFCIAVLLTGVTSTFNLTHRGNFKLTRLP